MTERELAVMCGSAATREVCGRAVAVLEGPSRDVAGAIDRIAVPMRCGLRCHESCFSRSKNHAAYRMEGPWETFWTPTIRQDGCSKLHAWRMASKWASRLMKRMRDAVASGPRVCRAIMCGHREEHNEIEVDGGVLEYAWCVEPHESLWPHWHVATNAKRVCYDWLREVWREVTLNGWSGIQVKKVSSPKRIAWYMAEYMTKAVFTDWILAIMFRKKLWWSTIPKKQRDSSQFLVTDLLTKETALNALEGSIVPRSRLSMIADVDTKWWQYVEGVRGKYSVWRVRGEHVREAVAESMQNGIDRERGKQEKVWSEAYRRGRGHPMAEMARAIFLDERTRMDLAAGIPLPPWVEWDGWALYEGRCGASEALERYRATRQRRGTAPVDGVVGAPL